MNRPFVRVLGVALTLGACNPASKPLEAPPEPLPGNPPAPTPVEPAPVEPAPVDSSLPTWDSVKSGHPEGATNPPSPLLIVSKDPQACFKGWLPGMKQPDPEVMELNGRVVDTPAQAVNATQVQCPPGQPQALLEAAAKRDASQK